MALPFAAPSRLGRNELERSTSNCNAVESRLPLLPTIQTRNPQPKMFDEPTRLDALQLVSLALKEDLNAASIGEGIDCTTGSLVDDSRTATAHFVSRAEGIVCGVGVCQLIVEQLATQLSLKTHLSDGDRVQPKQVIATLSGSAREILMLERTCLNFMGRLSGVSSLTQKYVAAIESTPAQVYDTRKTTPGFRRLEKWAVACGGGQNHRMGLYDAVLIKDNHLAFFESVVQDKSQTIPQAIAAARRWIEQHEESLPNGLKTTVQIEVDSLDQFQIALSTPCDMVLLDNFEIGQLRAAVELRNQRVPHLELEASGGVNLSTVRAIAETGIERISVGALTHSAINFDIGLDWDQQ